MEKAINTAFGWQDDENGNTVGIKRVKVSVTDDNKLAIEPADGFNKVQISLSSVKMMKETRSMIFLLP